jgi:hypothetical protein
MSYRVYSPKVDAGLWYTRDSGIIFIASTNWFRDRTLAVTINTGWTHKNMQHRITKYVLYPCPGRTEKSFLGRHKQIQNNVSKLMKIEIYRFLGQQ